MRTGPPDSSRPWHSMAILRLSLSCFSTARAIWTPCGRRGLADRLIAIKFMDPAVKRHFSQRSLHEAPSPETAVVTYVVEPLGPMFTTSKAPTTTSCAWIDGILKLHPSHFGQGHPVSIAGISLMTTRRSKSPPPRFCLCSMSPSCAPPRCPSCRRITAGPLAPTCRL